MSEVSPLVFVEIPKKKNVYTSSGALNVDRIKGGVLRALRCEPIGTDHLSTVCS